MYNESLLLEINRFKEILTYNNLITEIIGGLADDIVKSVIKSSMRSAIKNATKETLEKALKSSIVDFAQVISKADMVKKILPEVEAELIKKGMKGNPEFVRTAIRSAIDRTYTESKNELMDAAKKQASKVVQTAGKEAAQTAGKEVAQTTGKEVAQTTGKEVAQTAAKSVDDIPAWKAAAKDVIDNQMISRRIPPQQVMSGLKQSQKEVVQSTVDKIQKEAGQEVAELVGKAETKQGLIPAARKKVVDFLERIKLVKPNPKTGRRRLTYLGWFTALSLGFGGFYLAGALGENDVDIEETDTTGGSGESGGGSGESGGGSGVTGWRSLGKQYDDQIKTAMGLPTDERLSDADIDTLYNKLKENGKI